MIAVGSWAPDNRPMLDSAAWVFLVIFACLIGLWLLTVMVLRRLSRQAEDESGANPFTALAELLDEGKIDAGEYERRRRNLILQPTPLRPDGVPGERR